MSKNADAANFQVNVVELLTIIQKKSREITICSVEELFCAKSKNI